MTGNGSRARGARRPGLVAMLVAILAVAGCGDRGAGVRAGSGDAADGPPTTEAGAAGAAGAVASDAAPPAVVELGPGTVVGVSGDGAAAYVVAENPDPGVVGCEGMTAPQLFAVPLDGSTRTPLAADGGGPLSGDVVRGPAGAMVAVVDQCEEFFSRLATATERPGGRLADVRSVDGAAIAGLSPRVAWSSDGRSLITTTADEARDVVRLDLASGRRTTLLAGRRAIQAGELADGSLVALLPDGLLLGGTRLPVQGFGFSLAPDGGRLAVFGEDGLFVVDGKRDTSRLVAGPVAQATWSPDGRSVAYLSRGGVAVVDAGGGPARQVAGNAPISPPFFTPDGRVLLFTSARPTGQGI